MLVQAGGRSGIKVGDRLKVGFAPEEAHYFDAAGQRLAIFDGAISTWCSVSTFDAHGRIEL